MCLIVVQPGRPLVFLPQELECFVHVCIVAIMARSWHYCVYCCVLAIPSVACESIRWERYTSTHSAGQETSHADAMRLRFSRKAKQRRDLPLMVPIRLVSRLNVCATSPAYDGRGAAQVLSGTAIGPRTVCGAVLLVLQAVGPSLSRS